MEAGQAGRAPPLQIEPTPCLKLTFVKHAKHMPYTDKMLNIGSPLLQQCLVGSNRNISMFVGSEACEAF